MHSKAMTVPVIGALFILCAGGSPRAGAAPPDDACSLLTQNQVNAVLGTTVEPGQHMLHNNTHLCGWTEPGGPSPSHKHVVLAMKNANTFAIGKLPVKGIILTPVSGIGDDAYYATTPAFGTGLSFKKGSYAFNIRVYGTRFSTDQVKAKEKTLAQDVLSKL